MRCTTRCSLKKTILFFFLVILSLSPDEATGTEAAVAAAQVPGGLKARHGETVE